MGAKFWYPYVSYTRILSSYGYLLAELYGSDSEKKKDINIPCSSMAKYLRCNQESNNFLLLVGL